MPTKSKHSPIVCQYFAWKVFYRDRVYYADGRGGKYKLGKYSLGTRDRDEAMARLRQLDQRRAVELGLANAEAATVTGAIAIAEGWRCFLDYSGRAAVLGGVSAGTLKRYRAVRDKHLKFCLRQRIEVWNDFDKRQIERYGNWLTAHYAYRTAYFELTLLKSVNHWLVENELLPEACRLRYRLEKPKGTDTFCYSPTQVAAIIEYCQAKNELVWLGHVVIALAHTGLRISELAGLRWSDLDPNLNTIRVADERSSRRKKEPRVFRTTKGRPSEGEIKEWLGHADSRMVEHYRHLSSEDAHRKMDKIDFLGRTPAAAI